jgi:hypothetical protein
VHHNIPIFDMGSRFRALIVVIWRMSASGRSKNRRLMSPLGQFQQIEPSVTLSAVAPIATELPQRGQPT